MALWFETKIRYDKMMENGMVKKVTEAYLVDALSFTEAEAKIITHATPLISGDFTVHAVKKTKIAEIFNADSDKFWNAKIGFEEYDDKSGSNRMAISETLVGASDFEEAYTRLKEGMRGTLATWDIVSLSESQIIEIVP